MRCKASLMCITKKIIAPERHFFHTITYMARTRNARGGRRPRRKTATRRGGRIRKTATRRVAGGRRRKSRAKRGGSQALSPASYVAITTGSETKGPKRFEQITSGPGPVKNTRLGGDVQSRKPQAGGRRRRSRARRGGMTGAERRERKWVHRQTLRVTNKGCQEECKCFVEVEPRPLRCTGELSSLVRILTRICILTSLPLRVKLSRFAHNQKWVTKRDIGYNKYSNAQPTGTPSGVRTHSLELIRLALYQLSYRSVYSFHPSTPLEGLEPSATQLKAVRSAN